MVQPANPEYTGPNSANGTQESGHEGEAFVQPVAPEYTGPISANGTQEAGHEGEAVVQPVNPAYTGSINSDTTSAKGTQESGHEGEALFNLRILFIPQLSVVSQRLKHKPSIILLK